MSQVIVTSREEIDAIVSQAIRREMGSMMQTQRSRTNESFTSQQAAEYLGQSPNTLRQWRSQGRGPAYEKRGRNVRYQRNDLDVWRNANRVHTIEALESFPSGRFQGQHLLAAGVSHA